jgi:hypothetical protein
MPRIGFGLYKDKKMKGLKEKCKADETRCLTLNNERNNNA